MARIPIDLPCSFEGRTEPLIATGRLVLASCSLFAIWLDPSELAKYSTVAYLLFAAYVVYALTILFLVWISFASLVRLRLITHVLDLGLFSIFMYITEGPSSPFFVYFIFSILCATLRWQWRGVLWTTTAALTAFVAMGMYTGEVLGDPSFELNRFIVRTVYLGVVASFVGFLGAYEFQRRSQLFKLASWPENPSVDLEDVLRQVLEYAGKILGVPRVLFAWEEPDEPWLYLAILADGQLQRSRKSAAGFGPLVKLSLEEKSFFSEDVQASSAITAAKASFDVHRWEGKPLNEELRKLFAIKSVLSVNISGENFRGRLFYLDKSDVSLDDIVLAEVVAGHASASIDLFYFLQHVQQMVTVGERIRISRDLHDGVLQSLSVIGLRLRAALDLQRTNPQTSVEQLSEVENLIVQEQRELRSFIERLRQVTLVPSETEFKLAYWLEELRKAIERQWSLRVELKSGDVGEKVPKPLAREIYHIVREGLVNAARHSSASMASVELNADHQQVYITVSDNGTGFPFRGSYDYATLVSKGLGPATLKSRIGSLGGLLNIKSSDSGVQLNIVLPLPQQET